MKWLLGLILFVIAWSVLPGVWQGLGTMEKVWTVIIVVGLASLFIPGLRPLAAKLLLLVFLVIFLVGVYHRARQAYIVTAGNVRATASEVALDLWQTGRNWLGSLKPSLLGPGNLLDMAEGTQQADAAYARCLADAVGNLQQQGRLPASQYRTAQACLANVPRDTACMNQVAAIVTDADPYASQRCAQHNTLDRGRAGIKPFANALCFSWLPERLQDKVCIDKQAGQAANATLPGQPSQADVDRTRCLYGFLATNRVEASVCNQYADSKDLPRWEQCAVQRARETFGNRADPLLRECGVTW